MPLPRTGELAAADVDFSVRADPATLPEWMDEPCSYKEFRDCVRDLGKVNRWTLGYGPTLRFLEQVRARWNGTEPLRVLDVGSGGGDGLRRIALWAARKAVRVQLTGIDLNPHATRAAKEFAARDKRYAGIRWICGDVFASDEAQGADVVLSSLVTHHMSDGEIVRFVRWQESTARLGWLVNDLLRSRKAYRLFGLLSRLMRWHPFVRHDGPVSIRRGFREGDWQRLLREAGVPTALVRCSVDAPGRLCVARLK